MEPNLSHSGARRVPNVNRFIASLNSPVAHDTLAEPFRHAPCDEEHIGPAFLSAACFHVPMMLGSFQHFNHLQSKRALVKDGLDLGFLTTRRTPTGATTA